MCKLLQRGRGYSILHVFARMKKNLWLQMHQVGPYWGYTEYSYRKGSEGRRTIRKESPLVEVLNTWTLARLDLGLPDPPLRHGLEQMSSLSMLLWCCGIFFNLITEWCLYGLHCLMAGSLGYLMILFKQQSLSLITVSPELLIHLNSIPPG